MPFKRQKLLRTSRCVTLTRSSSPDPDSAYGIQEQERRLRTYARKHGFIVVDSVTLPGTSSGDPKTHAAVDALLCRRQSRKDFNSLLVADFSRLVRDTDAGLELKRRFNAAGINIVTPYVHDRMRPLIKRDTGEKGRRTPNGKNKKTRVRVDRAAADDRRRDSRVPAGVEHAHPRPDRVGVESKRGGDR